MLRYTLRRLLSLALSLFAASLLIFFVIELIPGDPASYMLGINAAEDTLAAVRAELGLDKPVLVRYATWALGMLQGDFGQSYAYRNPVADLMVERLRVTIPLALYALALSTIIAIPVGVIAASRRGGVTDTAIMGVTQIGISMPNFWFGILLVVFFSVKLRWFSAGGFAGWEAGFWQAIKSLTLPAVALAVPFAAIFARVLRSSLLDVLDAEFIRVARAKGLSHRQALWRHAFRNAMIPVLTILGLQFSFLIGGAVIIENVFYLPGLGRLAFQAISQRDLILIEGIVMLLVFGVILVNFLVDLTYAWVDPRLRSRE